jgi:hypothetical protein
MLEESAGRRMKARFVSICAVLLFLVFYVLANATIAATQASSISGISFTVGLNTTSTVTAGSSYTANISGSNFTSQTYFDVRFQAPGAAASSEAWNWQIGPSASHPAGTTTGTWTINGIRAHLDPADHTGTYVSVSATLNVSGASPSLSVSGISFSVGLNTTSSVTAGSSYTANISGSNLTSQTYFDVRFQAPGSAASGEAWNWQIGPSAPHPAGMTTGTWTVNGIRAHLDPSDHTGSYVSVLATLTVGASAQNIVYGTLTASLDTGSLAGTRFPIYYSYDASQVPSGGQGYAELLSFNFTLLGVSFTRSDIFQGGQVVFQNGVRQNVTASFQVVLPQGSPVTNITFGFGQPLGIAYIDLSGGLGSGSFSFQ